MIRCLKYDEIDFEKYNDCITHSAQYHFSATQACLEVYGASHWEFLVLEDYLAVMPIYITRKLGVKFATIPLGIQQLGIFSKEDLPQLNEAFLAELKQRYRIHYYAFNEKNQFLKSQLLQRKNYIISRNAYEAIRQNYTSDRRRNVRILPKNQGKIRLESSIDLEELKSFFYQYSKGLDDKAKAILLGFYQKYYDSNLLKIRTLYYDGEVASIAFLYDDGHTVYSTSLINHPRYLKENCPSILIDLLLQEFSECRNFSFMGSNQPQIETFFQRFGARQYTYSVMSQSKRELIKTLLKL